MNKIHYFMIFGLIMYVAGCSVKNQQYTSSSQPTLFVSEQYPSQPLNRPIDTLSPSLTQTRTPRFKPSQIFTPSLTFKPTSTFQKAAPDKLKKYIGIEHPPLPTGFKSGFGQLLQIDMQYPYVDFAVDIVGGEGYDMLWFSKFTNRDEEGYAHWVVVDLIPTPLYDKNEVLIPWGCKYGKDGEIDSEIIVTATFDAEVNMTRYVPNDKILKAWRANRAKEAFEEISTEGIECFADMAVGSVR